MSGKPYKEDHNRCKAALKVLTSKKIQENWSWPFMEPIDTTQEWARDYHKVVAHPMDLGTVKTKLGNNPKSCEYAAPKVFVKDVRLVFDNALLFNKNEASVAGGVYQAAQKLKTMFEVAIKEHFPAGEGLDRSEPPPPPPPTLPPPPQAAPVTIKMKAPKVPKAPKRGPSPSLAPSPPPGVGGGGGGYSSGGGGGYSSGGGGGSGAGGGGSAVVSSDAMEAVLRALRSNVNAKRMLWDYRVDQLKQLPAYTERVPKPIDGFKIDERIRKGKYRNKAAPFCADVRLFFANTLRYHSYGVAARDTRALVLAQMKVLEKEQLARSCWTGMPDKERWACHTLLGELLNLKSGSEQAASGFLFPTVHYMPDEPSKQTYIEAIARPMDLGTISSKLHTGEYSAYSQFAADVRLTFDNCTRYWSDPQRSMHGAPYVTAAQMLQKAFARALEKALQTGKLPRPKAVEKPSGAPRPPSIDSKTKIKFSVPSAGSAAVSSKPSPPPFAPSDHAPTSAAAVAVKVVGVAAKLQTKAAKVAAARKPAKVLSVSERCVETAKAVQKMKEPYIAHFVKPVDVNAFPNYPEYVKDPMDLTTLERRARTGMYDQWAAAKLAQPPLPKGATAVAAAVAAAAVGVVAVNEFERELLLIPGNCRLFSVALGETDRESMRNVADKFEAKAREEVAKLRANAEADELHRKEVAEAKDEAVRLRKQELAQRSTWRGRTLSSDELIMLDILDKLNEDPWVAQYSFHTPVAQLYDVEAFADYKAKITPSVPSDVGTVTLHVREGKHATFSSFMAAVNTCFDNAVKYYGETDQPSVNIREAAIHLDRMFSNYCADLIPMPLPSAGAVHEQHKAFVASVRQERERKVLDGRMRKKACTASLKVLKKDDRAGPFIEMIDERTFAADWVAQYNKVVACPMAIKTIENNLRTDVYTRMAEFHSDVNLVFDNAMHYNGTAEPAQKSDPNSVYSSAIKLKAVFDEQWAAESVELLRDIGREAAKGKWAEMEAAKKAVIKEKERVIEAEHQRQLEEVQMVVQRQLEQQAELAVADRKANRPAYVPRQRNSEPTTFQPLQDTKAEHKKREKAEKKRREEQLKAMDLAIKNAVAALEQRPCAASTWLPLPPATAVPSQQAQKPLQAPTSACWRAAPAPVAASSHSHAVRATRLHPKKRRRIALGGALHGTGAFS